MEKLKKIFMTIFAGLIAIVSILYLFLFLTR